jgi:aspartate kinase
MTNRVTVKKFGGTSLGSAAQIDRVAQYLQNCFEAGERFVVVASAMAGETSRLIALGKEVDPNPDPACFDQLFATGEHISIALLALALERRGVSAVALRGEDVPILAEGGHIKARIHHVDPKKLHVLMEGGCIPIVAGCQGVDHQTGKCVTFGRGGSDTTAVALAIALGGVVCEIYTDVDGVYTTDPRICPSAKLLSHINYLEMMEMASLGAKVMQIRSVDLAYRYKIPVHIRSAFSWKEGTLVTLEKPAYERLCVSTVTCDKNQAKIMMQGCPMSADAIQQILGPLAKAHINVDMIVQSFSASQKKRMDLYFTVQTADFDKALRIAEAQGEQLAAVAVTGDHEVAKVSALGSGMVDHYGVANKFFEILADAQIPVYLTSTSEIKISVLVPQDQAKQATDLIHKTFIEGNWDPALEYGDTQKQPRRKDTWSKSIPNEATKVKVTH